jgi:hypothetical protein
VSTLHGGAAAISGVLASSPDKAGTEQATNAARILAAAAAAAPHRAGVAVARAFLVSGTPRQLFAVVGLCKLNPVDPYL